MSNRFFNIRNYIIFAVLVSIVLGIVSLSIFRKIYSLDITKGTHAMDLDLDSGVYRRARVAGDNIEIFWGGEWKDFEVRGIQISSFSPGYIRNHSNVKKEDVSEWLNKISDMGANTIHIPYLQPPNFYSALYDFNLNRQKNDQDPLFILHSIPIDIQTAVLFYNTFDPEVVRNMRADIRNTVNALHGNAVLVDNTRHHAGTYLKDVSPYVLGYIIGDNTLAEIITLTNQRFNSITSYDGINYYIVDGDAFECFVAESLDYISEYEMSKFKTLSLYSYLSSPETDPLEHRNESNQTRYANFNLDNIYYNRGNMKNLIACYTAHPNLTILDYELSDNPKLRPPNLKSGYQLYLERLTEIHELPVVIVGTGIPASRGISLVNLTDGYNRGGHSEQQQAQLLIRMLSDIKNAGCKGAVIQSFQDNWMLASAYTQNLRDENAAHYWKDQQSSDTGFGLMEFIPSAAPMTEVGFNKNQRVCVVDGDISEWGEKFLYEVNGKKFSAKCDTEYLYIMAYIPGSNLMRDNLYIALDITPKSGAVSWEAENIDFPFAADFVLHFNGYKNSRVLTHSRYDLFNYRYSYYSYIIKKQPEIPAPDEPIFNEIYMMNRYNVMLREAFDFAPPLYHHTGALTYGTTDINAGSYNSMTDFNITDDVLEARIPWSLINVRDPVKGIIQPDFYSEGLDIGRRFDQGAKINKINMTFIYQPQNGIRTAYAGVVESGVITFKLPDLKKMKYHSRLRLSAQALKDYWAVRPCLHNENAV